MKKPVFEIVKAAAIFYYRNNFKELKIPDIYNAGEILNWSYFFLGLLMDNNIIPDGATWEDMQIILFNLSQDITKETAAILKAPEWFNEIMGKCLYGQVDSSHAIRFRMKTYNPNELSFYN